MKSFKEYFLPISFFVIVIIIYFFKVLFLDYNLLPADNIYYNDTMFSQANKDVFNTRSQNRFLEGDVNNYHYPYQIFNHNTLFKNHTLPLWNPYSACGTPNIANGISSPFEIIKLLLNVFCDPKKVLGLATIFGLMIAGIGTFLLLKSYKVNTFGALVAAFAFAFNGYFDSLYWRSCLFTLIWMPLIFLFTKKLIENKSIVYFNLLSITIGIQFFGFHYGASLFLLFSWFIYFVFETHYCHFNNNVEFDSKWIKTIVRYFIFFALALIIGLLLSSIQTLSFLDHITQAPIYEAGRGYKYNLLPVFERIKIGIFGSKWLFMEQYKYALLTFFVPEFFGNVIDEYFFSSTCWYTFEHRALHIGVITFVFFLYAFRRKDKRIIMFFTGFAAFCFFVIHQYPVFNLINITPIFASVAPFQLRAIFCFALCIAAGFGADYFYNNIRNILNDKREIIFMSLFILAGIFLGLLNIANHKGCININFHKIIYYRMYFPFLFTALFLLVIFISRIIKKPNIIIALAFIIFLSSLIFFAKGFNQIIPNKYVFPVTKEIEFIKKDKDVFRVGTDSTLMPNKNLIYSIYYTDAFEVAQIKQYQELISAYNYPAKSGDIHCLPTLRFDSPLIDLMNVKYIWLQKDRNLQDFGINSNHYKKVFSHNLDIYSNINFLPRAFLVDTYKIYTNGNDILKQILDKEFKPQNIVYLEEDPFPNKTLPDKSLSGGSAEILKYGENEVTIKTLSDEYSLLFLSDTYYKGWKAFIDGKNTRIFKADYCFRAVAVPKGEHIIKFLYEPEVYKYALILSLTGMLVIIVLFLFKIFSFVKGRKKIGYDLECKSCENAAMIGVRH
jgi:hypothetical protein